MFQTTSFNQPIGDWNVKNVTDMECMFATSEFNQPLDKWDVSGVQSMQSMFWRNKKFNQNISDWKINKRCKISDMFRLCNIDTKNKPIRIF